MGFVTYDLIFLAVFIVLVIIFLSTRKKNLTRQGIMYLYKTQLGIKFIDAFAKKFEKILRPLQYVVIACGYVLMIGVVWYFIKSVYLYLTTPIADLISAPPVVPLIPYAPKLFGLESFFPPLYFTYFIIVICIVAVFHEFSHGIFARLHGFKIHSTGFAFLGPILGAFVEPDEKQMNKAKKIPQLSVLAAGTFANIVIFILFSIVLWLFFASLFVPAGVKFNFYAQAEVNVDQIEVLENSSIREGLLLIEANDQKYYVNGEELKSAIENDNERLIVFEDSPAFRGQLHGAIVEFDGEKITSREELTSGILSKEPGEIVNIKTVVVDNARDSEFNEEREYEIELAEKDGNAYLGIGILPQQSRGLIGFIYDKTFAKMKDPSVYYVSELGDFGWFVYYLLWWTVIINLLVALFNMLPISILDGGRFFYLTVWGITRSEKAGRKAYSIATWALLLMIVLLMIRWAFRFI